MELYESISTKTRYELAGVGDNYVSLRHTEVGNWYFQVPVNRFIEWFRKVPMESVG